MLRSFYLIGYLKKKTPANVTNGKDSLLAHTQRLILRRVYLCKCKHEKVLHTLNENSVVWFPNCARDDKLNISIWVTLFFSNCKYFVECMAVWKIFWQFILHSVMKSKSRNALEPFCYADLSKIRLNATLYICGCLIKQWFAYVNLCLSRRAEHSGNIN